ncbi:hypothetical protein ABZZ20_31815 [Streptomyces sp. NPDC006430]|uniref:hypothetical protein n=1 Tax=Streptomyces sp. NPDC006430 TaxID=3154299 RepID=UPI0033A270E6
MKVHPLLRLLGNVALAAVQVFTAIVVVNYFDGVLVWMYVAITVLGLLGTYRGARVALRELAGDSPERARR